MQQQKPQAQVNVQDLNDIVCEVCGGKDFAPIVHLKHISVFQSPTGQEGQALVQAGFVCLGCSTKNQFELKSKAKPLFGTEATGHLNH